jgi:hypothetical protein
VKFERPVETEHLRRCPSVFVTTGIILRASAAAAPPVHGQTSFFPLFFVLIWSPFLGCYLLGVRRSFEHFFGFEVLRLTKNGVPAQIFQLLLVRKNVGIIAHSAITNTCTKMVQGNDGQIFVPICHRNRV